MSPRVSGQESRLLLYSTLYSGASGFGLQPPQLCRELAGFALHLTKCWPRSQATAIKKANIQTKTNHYFSDFVLFVLIFRGIWISKPDPDLDGGGGDPESWLSTRQKLSRRDIPVICNCLLSFFCLHSCMANNGSNGLCLLNTYKQARNCDELFTQPQPSWMFSEFTEWMMKGPL